MLLDFDMFDQAERSWNFPSLKPILTAYPIAQASYALSLRSLSLRARKDLAFVCRLQSLYALLPPSPPLCRPQK